MREVRMLNQPDPPNRRVLIISLLFLRHPQAARRSSGCSTRPASTPTRTPTSSAASRAPSASAAGSSRRATATLSQMTRRDPTAVSTHFSSFKSLGSSLNYFFRIKHTKHDVHCNQTVALANSVIVRILTSFRSIRFFNWLSYSLIMWLMSEKWVCSQIITEGAIFMFRHQF